MSGRPLSVRGARLRRSLSGQMRRCVGTRTTPFYATLNIILEQTEPRPLTVHVNVKKSVVHDDVEPALGARGSKFDAEKQ